MTKRQSLQIAILVTAALVFCLSSANATTPSTTTSSTAPKHKRSTHSVGATKSNGTKLGGTRSSGAKAGTATKSGATKSSAARTSGAKSVGSSTASKTASKTGKRGTKAAKGGRQRGQTAPTPERISEIQSALAKNGAMDGSPSGKWDESTSEAMRKFQAAHGLNPSGKLDALTLRQLGLGSSTAGLAPPTPMAGNSSPNLLTDSHR